ncbi:hypothetical protein AB0N06_09585 [Streptomyces sp. NPDC051020]|uniref:hypothetical protein n=1 Tax=Streptomyces sp. NPDC051020 TaxID=3155409 RepID=UPI00343455C6
MGTDSPSSRGRLGVAMWSAGVSRRASVPTGGSGFTIPGLLILHIRVITRVRDYMDGPAVARIGERVR